MGTETFVGKLIAVTPPPEPGLRPPVRELTIITFAYHADGTVTATCGRTTGSGKSDGEALRAVQQQLRAERNAARQPA